MKINLTRKLEDIFQNEMYPRFFMLSNLRIIVVAKKEN